MKKFSLVFLLAGILLLVSGMILPQQSYAADKTITVKVTVNPDFWNSKIIFPNGNKAKIDGIGVSLLDKGTLLAFKTLTPGQNEATLTYTGVEGADYQIKIPYLAGPGAYVYQQLEKVSNNGQTVSFAIGVETYRPLSVKLTQE